MALAYAVHLQASTFPVESPLQPFRGEDTGDAGEVVGYGYIRPGGCVEERLDGGEAIVAEFED
jgi:hypothetical protein